MHSSSDRKKFSAYLKGGFTDVQGWCSPDLCRVASICAEIQAMHGIEGGVGEIGVHHGKFLIALALLKERQPAVAIDVFDLQSLNVDRSGRGNKEIFLDNFNKHAGEREVHAVTGDSMQLTPDKILSATGTIAPLSMFSVDGCHTAEHTLNDLLIADQMTGSGAIIFIDDYYNPNWPGVQEGIAKYFFAHPVRYVPLCFAFSKLLLVDIAYHDRFLQRLEPRLKAVEKWAVKRVKRFGWDNFSVRRA